MEEYNLRINGRKATFVLPVTIKMIDFFRLATKDTNEIHDPSKTEKPWALGFQLTSILDQTCHQFLRQLYGKDYYFTSQKINFRANVTTGDTIEVKLTEDDEQKINTEITNKSKQCIKNSWIKYSHLYEIYPEQGPSFLNKPLEQEIVETDVSDFYKGIGLDVSGDVPISFLLSLLSSTLIKESESKKEELGDKKLVYTSHNIQVYSGIRHVGFGDSVMIGTTSVEKSRIGYNVEISAVLKKCPLYQAKISLALVDKIIL